MAYQILPNERLQKMLATTSPHSFQFNIAKMHDIYRLPRNTQPTLDDIDLGMEDPITRLTKFKKTLLDEVAEFDTRDDKSPEKLSIKEKLQIYRDALARNPRPFSHQELEEMRQECLTDIADWLTDMIVYCRSEAMKFGLPLEDVQDAVMASNFTKLPSDGIPVYDANGKFQKDMTNFVAPESAIRTMLFGARPAHPYVNITEQTDKAIDGFDPVI